LPWQHPLGDLKKKVKRLMYDQLPTKGENLVKIGQVDPEITCLKGLFFFVLKKETSGCTRLAILNSGVT